MKAVVVAFNKEKALVGAFSVITNLRMELFEALEGMVSDWKLKGWSEEAECWVTTDTSQPPQLAPRLTITL